MAFGLGQDMPLSGCGAGVYMAIYIMPKPQ